MPADWSQIVKYGLEAIKTGMEGVKAAGQAAPGLPFGGGSGGPGGFQNITPTSQPLGGGGQAPTTPSNPMNALQRPDSFAGGGGIGGAINAGSGIMSLLGGLFGGKKEA